MPQKMALGNNARTTLSRAAASCLGSRVAPATACSVRCGGAARNLHTAPVSGVPIAGGVRRGSAAIHDGSRRQLSAEGGGVDYSSLMAGPGTALHNSIMESAARKQTGWVRLEMGCAAFCLCMLYCCTTRVHRAVLIKDVECDEPTYR